MTGGTNPYSSDKPLDPLAVDSNLDPIYTAATNDGRLIETVSDCDSGSPENCAFTDNMGAGTGFSALRLYNYLLVVEDAAGNKISAVTQRYRSPFFAGDFAAGGTAAFRLEPRYRRAAVFPVDEQYQQSLTPSQIMVHVPMDQSGLDHDFFIHKYITSDYVTGTTDTDNTRATWPLQGNNGTWLSNAAKCHEIFMRTLSFDNTACGNGAGVNTTTRTLQSKQNLAPLGSLRQGAFWKACRNSSFADEDGNTYNLHLASDPEWIKASDWGDVDLNGTIDQSVYTANIGLTIHGTVEYNGVGADNTTTRCHSDNNPGSISSIATLQALAAPRTAALVTVSQTWWVMFTNGRQGSSITALAMITAWTGYG